MHIPGFPAMRVGLYQDHRSAMVGFKEHCNRVHETLKTAGPMRFAIPGSRIRQILAELRSEFCRTERTFSPPDEIHIEREETRAIGLILQSYRVLCHSVFGVKLRKDWSPFVDGRAPTPAARHFWMALVGASKNARWSISFVVAAQFFRCLSEKQLPIPKDRKERREFFHSPETFRKVVSNPHAFPHKLNAKYVMFHRNPEECVDSFLLDDQTPDPKDYHSIGLLSDSGKGRCGVMVKPSLLKVPREWTPENTRLAVTLLRCLIAGGEWVGDGARRHYFFNAEQQHLDAIRDQLRPARKKDLNGFSAALERGYAGREHWAGLGWSCYPVGARLFFDDELWPWPNQCILALRRLWEAH